MLDDQTFEAAINSTPLISIDPIVKKDNKILLSKYIAKNELNIESKLIP